MASSVPGVKVLREVGGRRRPRSQTRASRVTMKIWWEADACRPCHLCLRVVVRSCCGPVSDVFGSRVTAGVLVRDVVGAVEQEDDARGDQKAAGSAVVDTVAVERGLVVGDGRARLQRGTRRPAGAEISVVAKKRDATRSAPNRAPVRSACPAGVPCACLPEPPPIDSCRRVLRPDRAAAVVCVRGSCAVKYVDRRLRCCVSASHAALRLRWGAAASGPPRYEASTDEEAKR
jgi:hypothetical protein